MLHPSYSQTSLWLYRLAPRQNDVSHSETNTANTTVIDTSSLKFERFFRFIAFMIYVYLTKTVCSVFCDSKAAVKMA